MYSDGGVAANLKAQVHELWNSVVSPNTARTYEVALQHFLHFVTLASIVTPFGQLPLLTEDLLINYVTHCFTNLSLKFNTIKLYLAGIRFHYLKAGFNNPLSGYDRLECILRAIKRRDGGNNSLTRMPITLDILVKICHVLHSGLFSPITDQMLHCACLMAFFGFLRCGEFTVRNSNTSDYLRIGDINMAEDRSYYTLFLKVSKTDPFRKGVVIHIFENSKLEPVKYMYQYITNRISMGANAASPLFSDSGEVLSRDKFISYIRTILSRLGLPEVNYCGHSFRIGAATSAAAAGIEDHMIQTLGRWSSNCYTRYIRISKDTIRMAQNHMCK